MPIEIVTDPVQNVNPITLKNNEELQITEAPKLFCRFDDIFFPKTLTGFSREDAHEIMEDFLKLLETGL